MASKKKAGPSRMDKRREADAAEAREREKEKDDDEEADDEDEEEEEAVEDEAGGDDDDEDAPKKKKKAPAKKKAAAPKAAKPKRTRTPKEVRMKAIWVVFDNGSKRVGTFQFNEKKQAEKLLDQKREDNKTYFLQLVKEPLELEEKEKAPAKK
jgi:hypothetical protein